MSESHELPTATVKPARSGRWLWIIPLLALIFAGVLVGTYSVKRGRLITVRLNNGHGIKPTDVVRCRGIVVGQVEEARLSGDMASVELRVRLEPAAKDVARAGSRFWVVRPGLSLTGATGLDTLAGPRYLAVIPGEGAEQTTFVGMEEPPIVEAIDADGLEITLIAARRGGIRAGSPILYRQVRVGTVLSVALAGDAASVEMRGYIRPAYASLVRDNSRFWTLGNAQLELGLTGLKVGVESVESLIEGGVAIATPEAAGNRVSTGHRFVLSPQAEEEWTRWRPHLPVGSDLLPPGAVPPPVVRISVRKSSEKFAGLWRSTDLRKGWAVVTEQGLVGPAELLGDQGVVEVAGQRIDLAKTQASVSGPLVMLPVRIADVQPLTASQLRRMEKPEECLIFTDHPDGAIDVAAGRLRADKVGWWIDPSLPLDSSLSGAAVVARSDGKVVGVLIVAQGRGFIEPLHEGN